MTWLQGWGTVQPEEILWTGFTLFAISWVHFRAQREAAEDERSARQNNTHLPQRVRRNAEYISRARKHFERLLMAAQACFFIPGVRALLLPPAPAALRSGQLLAVGLLLTGEILIVIASTLMTRAREMVREGRIDGVTRRPP